MSFARHHDPDVMAAWTVYRGYHIMTTIYMILAVRRRSDQGQTSNVQARPDIDHSRARASLIQFKLPIMPILDIK